MRLRDPRRRFARRREARTRVRIVDVPQPPPAPDGSVGSRQSAEVTLPRSELQRLWTPEYLERLARTYWRFLTRVSLGLLRVLYTPDAREIAVLGRPFVLLRFRAPEYQVEADGGAVTWRIETGLLVAPAGRGKGFLRIGVQRPPEPQPRGPLVTVRVSSEVSNFYPLIAGWGWFARAGRILYRETQLRVHVLITNAFLRSLARLDLAPSVVGARLRSPTGTDPTPTAARARPGARR